MRKNIRAWHGQAPHAKKGRTGRRGIGPTPGVLLPAMALIGIWPGTGWAAEYQVTNLNNSGTGSLRQAISSAGDGDTITFASSLSGTITLTSELPALNAVTFAGGEGIVVSRSGSSFASALNLDNSKPLSGNLAMDMQASTSGNYAYGLDGNGDSITVEELSGSVSATANANTASGLYASGGNVEVTTLSGSVSATANTNTASGLYAYGGNVEVTTLSGSVSAKAGGDWARGLHSNQAVTVGELSGSVSATADDDWAYGLSGGSGGITVTTLSGSVSATTGADSAYGLYSDNGGDVTVTTLSSSGSVSAKADALAYALGSADGNVTVGELAGTVSAEADRVSAYGLYGDEGTVKVTTLSGSVSATAGTDSAYGLYSDENAVEVTTLSGSVSATSGGFSAFGLRSDNDMTVGTLSGSVTASADGTRAYGLYSYDGDMTVTTLSGSVSATAGGSRASGLWSYGTLTVGTLSGSVSATGGGGSVHGVYSDDGDVEVATLSGSVSASGDSASGVDGYGKVTVGELSGSVTVSADGREAYGLYSYGGTLGVGTLSGSVTATAGSYGAFGLYSERTLNNGTGGAAEISGSVSATANGLAVAVSADRGMNLSVTGTLNATDTSGAGNAYAIAAGSASGSAWTAGGNYADTVTLGDGAAITGDIDLGGGTNLLTLAGAGTLIGDISNITTLTKSGSGTWSTTGGIATTDLTVNDGTLLVNVTQSATPTVAATGTVTNNGEIRFVPDGGIASGTFTVLTGGTLAGSGAYTTDSLLLTATVNGNQVDLTKRSFADIFAGADPDQRQIAGGFDDNHSSASGDLRDLISAIEQFSTQAEAETAMDQLTSLLLGQGVDVSVNMTRLQSLTTQQRMAERRAYQTAGAPDPDDPSTWPEVAAIGDLSGLFERSPENGPNGLHLRVVGRSGSMDDHDGDSGYDTDTVLFSGGYDRVLDDHLLAGVGLGYASTGAKYRDDGNSTAHISAYDLSLYASWFDRAWYADAILSAAYETHDTRRNLPALATSAGAETEARTLSAKTEIGRRFDTGDWGLTPLASLEYIRFRQNGYTETGAGAADLKVGAVEADFLESGLGIKLDRAWKTPSGTIVPELSAKWRHEWLNQDRAVSYSLAGLPGIALSQPMAEPDTDALSLGAGVNLVLDTGLTLTARYRGDFTENARSHSLIAEAQYAF